MLGTLLFRVTIDNHLMEKSLGFLYELNLDTRFYYVLWSCELLIKPGHARAKEPSSSTTTAATKSAMRFELIVMFVKIQND